MAAHAKMVDLGDIGAALCNLPSPKKPEEELDDEPDPMWAIRLGHSGSIKSILEDWTRCGSESPRASFFRWAARDHISSPVKVTAAPERSMHLRHENRLAKFMKETQQSPKTLEKLVSARRQRDFEQEEEEPGKRDRAASLREGAWSILTSSMTGMSWLRSATN
ncbi:hypothetical protein AK812_SmicGene28744 [Symbiodinium microadriaticum]|uniref:Uncharacterized protein n=1 Tax=Symbiodinium microadriaticum TaxID=2951 RepID=A0A1Q9D3J9_SYMMI|nr:hypothetical protein AK812_SmicGene28744 [Symbiodinium microadriaticum]CAE7284895.1 unnamed protein product [Symbiodinium microadriaticum]CAE7938871.1 unnamed protein product [Symbiodinium sp. KB8]